MEVKVSQPIRLTLTLDQLLHLVYIFFTPASVIFFQSSFLMAVFRFFRIIFCHLDVRIGQSEFYIAKIDNISLSKKRTMLGICLISHQILPWLTTVKKYWKTG